MNNKKQIILLKQVRELIDEIGGIDKSSFIKIGVTLTELLDPTKETLIKLHDYKFKMDAQKQDIERLDFNL